MIGFMIFVLVGGILLYAVVIGGAGKGTKAKGGKAAGKRVNVRDKWSIINVMAGTGPAGLKNAVSEADKLFDYALKQQGYAGDTMGDRLKSAKRGFSSYSIYDAVWRAHKLRNALAHEVGFDLVPSQAKEALDDFKAGLRDLGAL